jgi:hypothetical protein
MKTFLLAAAVSACVGLGSAAYVQDPDRGSSAPQQSEQEQSGTVSFTGCLTKGASANEYMIADQASGQKVAFLASEQLEKYVNQTIKLSGKVVVRGGQRQFQPERVQPVSTSCEASDKAKPEP